MAILHLKSGNKDLSFVIQKNPASGMFVKSLKMGALFCYYPLYEGVTNEQEYLVYFKDASDKITYKRHPDEQFEYLNSSKYTDARFINDAIQDVLHACREGKGDSPKYDVPCNHSVMFNVVETQFKTIDIFRRYFNHEIEIDAVEISKDNYKMTFTTERKMKLQYLLQVINLFGVFAQLNSPTYTYVTEDLVKKYIRIINDIDAPYFIRYLMKIRMCRNEKTFEQVKTDLSTSNKANIVMQYGDTHDNRIAWVLSQIAVFKDENTVNENMGNL